MNKLICIIVFVGSISGLLQAQEAEKTIGLRAGYDALEVSYQHPLETGYRMEWTVGVNTFGYDTIKEKLCHGVGLNAVYQLVRDLSSITYGLNWYYGVGASVLTHADLFGAGALGQIGVEYNFKSPVRLSLDYRPGLYWLPGTVEVIRFSWNAPCLALRYRF